MAPLCTLLDHKIDTRRHLGAKHFATKEPSFLFGQKSSRKQLDIFSQHMEINYMSCVFYSLAQEVLLANQSVLTVGRCCSGPAGRPGPLVKSYSKRLVPHIQRNVGNRAKCTSVTLLLLLFSSGAHCTIHNAHALPKLGNGSPIIAMIFP